MGSDMRKFFQARPSSEAIFNINANNNNYYIDIFFIDLPLSEIEFKTIANRLLTTAYIPSCT